MNQRDDDLLALDNPTGAPAPRPRDDSGLIDIRAFARTLASARSNDSIDAVAAHPPVEFAGALVLVPSVRSTPPDRRIRFALVGMAAALTLQGVLVVAVTRDHERESPAIARPPAAVTHAVATEEPVAPPESPPPAETAVAARRPSSAPSATPSKPAPVAATPPVQALRAALARDHEPAETVRRLRGSEPQPNPEAAVALVEEDACGQVACVVGGYAEACCARWAGSTLPDVLDREALAAGIATISTWACTPASPGSDVRASVKIAADGSVTGVTIKDAADPALSTCVEAAVHAGVFAKTKRGGAFAYTWRF